MRFLPSINALRAFQASARSLSFTKAALELNVTQGAVSHQVKGLEDRLGVKLFLRVRQRLQLTQQGKGYLPFVRQALDLLEAGNAYLETNEKSGILTVSVSPNFATKWLVPRLGDFIATHPEIELRISASTQHVDLARSDIDMAVRHGPGDRLDLDVQKAFPGQGLSACSPEFFQAPFPI
ncbi:MAG: LysR family transcriptional regulator [Rhodospirillaceae bacterium]|nr:LysR family transcriptional regulator [Rhodospirillaceae bacterium]